MKHISKSTDFESNPSRRLWTKTVLLHAGHHVQKDSFPKAALLREPLPCSPAAETAPSSRWFGESMCLLHVGHERNAPAHAQRPSERCVDWKYYNRWHRHCSCSLLVIVDVPLSSFHRFPYIINKYQQHVMTIVSLLVQYVYIYIYIERERDTCVYVCMYVYIYIYIYMYEYVYVDIDIYIYAYMHTYGHTYNMHIYIYIRMCIYIYIYIYTYIHVCMYVLIFAVVIISRINVQCAREARSPSLVLGLYYIISRDSIICYFILVCMYIYIYICIHAYLYTHIYHTHSIVYLCIHHIILHDIRARSPNMVQGSPNLWLLLLLSLLSLWLLVLLLLSRLWRLLVFRWKILLTISISSIIMIISRTW